MTQTDEKASFFLIDEIPWPSAEQNAATAPREIVEQARRSGAKRKFLAQGEGGFFTQYSVLPPGYTVPRHHHDHNEVIVLLAGSCTMLGGDDGPDGPSLKPADSMVLIAGHDYGFTSGPDGMTFLTLRTAAAGTALA